MPVADENLPDKRAIINPESKVENNFKGKIEEVIYHGDHTRVRLDILGNKENNILHYTKNNYIIMSLRGFLLMREERREELPLRSINYRSICGYIIHYLFMIILYLKI